jgi:uncharacterized protein (DUF1697 family)
MKYLELLRGVNVGGKNTIKMPDLKACFEGIGLTEVATFIQSGNVLFSANVNSIIKLTKEIEGALSKTFNYNSRVVVLSREQLASAVKHAPPGFGKNPAGYRYDVVFMRKPLSPAEALKSVSVKEGVDQAFAGPDVHYFANISKASQSRLPRLITEPVYQSMTIRNWKTTTKLLKPMDT